MSRCFTKKSIEAHDQTGTVENRYKSSKLIRFKTSMLRSDLCDFSDAYVVVTEKITVESAGNDAYEKKLIFQNNEPFNSCITKINSTLVDNAEDLYIVMPIYNVVEYSRNYGKTAGSLWNYYRDEPNSGLGGDDNNINYSIKDLKSFDYKTSITGKLEDGNAGKDDAKIAVPLKYLSNFWRTLDMPLINCEVSLALTWSEKCVLTSKTTRDASDNPLVLAITSPTNVTFKITDTKLYVPVVTLSTENDNKLLEQLQNLKEQSNGTNKDLKCLIRLQKLFD